MRRLRGPVHSGGSLLLTVALLPLLAGTASADSPADIAEDLMVISVMSLPLMGMFVLLALSLPPLYQRPLPPEPFPFHVANVLGATALLTFIDALSVPHLVRGGGDLTLTLAVGGLANLLVCTLVFSRHMLFPPTWAVLVGAALALVSMAWWSIAIGMDHSQVFEVHDTLALSLPVWMLLFVGLLVLETLRHHPPSGEGAGGEPPVNMRERTLRLGELMVASAALGAVLVVLWS